MIYTLSNITEYQAYFSIVKMRHVTGTNSKNKYQLLESLKLELSNKDVINIDFGFIWDLASVPRLLWSIMPPDGDFTLGFLIHDWLYQKRKEHTYNRQFCDNEMLKWCLKTSGTKNKFSFRNLDIYVRYWGVRAFGWLVWNEIIKIK